MSKNQRLIACGKHGSQGIGLVCEQIAYAVDSGQRVGFFWDDDTDTARPDAWCSECERALVALRGACSDEWLLMHGSRSFVQAAGMRRKLFVVASANNNLECLTGQPCDHYQSELSRLGFINLVLFQFHFNCFEPENLRECRDPFHQCGPVDAILALSPKRECVIAITSGDTRYLASALFIPW